ncbi:MAG: hypothetical protein QXX17_07035 [Conexivisphaerales archaeon]
MDNKSVARYLRLVQIGLSLLTVAVVAMLLVSSIGSLAMSSVQSSLVSSNPQQMLIRADYSIYNPGPVPLDPLTITLQVTAPDGTPLTYPSSNTISISPFASSSGTLYFNLTLLPGADQKLASLLQSSQQPTVSAKVTSSMAGLVRFTLSLTSNSGG